MGLEADWNSPAVQNWPNAEVDELVRKIRGECRFKRKNERKTGRHVNTQMGQRYGHTVSDPELDSEGRMARTLGGKCTDRVQRHPESKSTVTTTLCTQNIFHTCG